MKRGLLVGALACALVLIGGVGAVWWRHHRAGDRLEAACDANRTNAASAPDHAGTSGGRKVYVLGDSYSTGFGLEDPSDAWPYLLAEREGWDATVDGMGGTGFTTAGACGSEDYLTRAARIPADTYLVILEGGLNDQREGHVGELTDRVEVVVEEVQTRAPDATIVVVGPSLTDYYDDDQTRAASAAVDAGATAAGVQFFDALDWAPTKVDTVHPDEAGQRAYAAALAEALAS